MNEWQPTHRIGLERSVPATDKRTKPIRSIRQDGVRRHLRRIATVLLIAVTVAAVFWFTILRPPLVTVAEVTRGDVADEVEATGTVTADVLPDIASKITGRVEQVFVNEGDPVQKGEIVAKLDQIDLRRQVEAARARLAGAKLTAEQLQRETIRRQTLLAERSPGTSLEITQQFENRYAVAQRTVEAAEADLASAEYNLSLTHIPSLVSGIVIKRWVVPGASVVPGQVMFTVADQSLIYVQAFADQSFTGKLKKGQPATVILRGRENQPLHGYVLRISPQASAETEETVAHVAFTLPRDEFQLGQWAEVFIQVAEAKDALTVPRATLMPIDNMTFVFVVGADNRLRQEPVTILAETPRHSMVAVDGDLRRHERVVLMPMGLKVGQAVRPQPGDKAPAAGPQS